MAVLKRKVPQSVDGNYFVDTTCINCDASRKYAPANFGDTGDSAFVKKQPDTQEEILQTQQALLSCPVGAIGMIRKDNLDAARRSLPAELAPGIFIMGFNHPSSYGADSYFLTSAMGNWMIDAPRFVPSLAEHIEGMGGLKYIFLTHRDDVGDAHKYAKHFAAKRLIHREDAHAQRDAELILDGADDHLLDDARLIFTPGHTNGHMVMLWQGKHLFTGDHFAWRPSLNAFGSFEGACWYSWQEQIRSVAKLKVWQEVEAIYPGHGRRGRIEKGDFPRIIESALVRMKSIRAR